MKEPLKNFLKSLYFVTLKAENDRLHVNINYQFAAGFVLGVLVTLFWPLHVTGTHVKPDESMTYIPAIRNPKL